MNKDLLQQTIAELPARIADVRTVMLATLDGIAVTAAGVEGDTNRLAAMTSSALGLAKRMIETASAGQLDQLSAAGSEGQIFVYAVGETAALVVITRKAPNIALVNWEAKKVLTELCLALS